MNEQAPQSPKKTDIEIAQQINRIATKLSDRALKLGLKNDPGAAEHLGVPEEEQSNYGDLYVVKSEHGVGMGVGKREDRRNMYIGPSNRKDPASDKGRTLLNIGSQKGSKSKYDTKDPWKYQETSVSALPATGELRGTSNIAEGISSRVSLPLSQEQIISAAADTLGGLRNAVANQEMQAKEAQQTDTK